MANGTSFERGWLTAKQAAAEIGMSVQWLYQCIKDGNGPPLKRRGRKILIHRDKLAAWDDQPTIP